MVPCVNGPPSTHREYRYLQPRVLRESFELCAFFQHGLIETGRPAPPIRPRVRADEFIHVTLSDGPGGRAHRGKRIVSQELTLAAH
jgi:hypothetical protein